LVSLTCCCGAHESELTDCLPGGEKQALIHELLQQHRQADRSEWGDQNGVATTQDDPDAVAEAAMANARRLLELERLGLDTTKDDAVAKKGLERLRTQARDVSVRVGALADAKKRSYRNFATKLEIDLRELYAQRSFVATASPKGNVQGQVQRGQPTVDLLSKPHDLPGSDEQREQNEKKGCCCRCCVTNDHDTYALPANTLLVETNLDIYDALDEYDEIATQFAYVSTFTIVIPVGSIMSLIRNLIEVHTDALHTFRDFRRPVPRMIDSKQVRNKPIALKPFSRHSA
jgi:hypothetical protein